MAVSSYDKETLSQSDQDKIAEVTSKAEAGEMSWADAHSTAEEIRASAGYSGGQYGDGYYKVDDDTGGFGNKSYEITGGGGGGGSSSKGSGSSYKVNDYSDYLKDLYAANTAAELAALKSTYEQNAADLDAQAAKIPETYTAARNETAAQSDLSRQAFNEYANARGLNTGTSGQAELSRSATLQGNLAGIASSEADALSDNALERQKLAVAYSNAVNQAEASGNSALAQALYQEYIRQDEAYQAADAAAQAQSNWEAQFQSSQQQYADSVASNQKEYAYNLATTMISAGVMPDSTTLASAGISEADAQALLDAVKATSSGTSTTSPSTKSVSTGGNTTTGGTVTSPVTGGNELVTLSDYGQLVLKSMQDSVNKNGGLTSAQKSHLMDLVAYHELTQAEVNQILDELGL